jgi:small subunit ribosomal protein S2
MSQTVSKELLKEMMDNACHFGHRISRWNPKMRRYLYGAREGVHIIDLVKAHKKLEEAMAFITDQISKGKNGLIVCTKLQAKRLVEDVAEKTGLPYVTTKWIPGLLTNYKTLRNRIKYLRDLKSSKESGEFERYTKKEALELEKQIKRLQERLGGVEEMLKVPDFMIVGDGVRDKNAVEEARRLGIPVVGIVDSNADPETMTHPVPGNDDAIKSLTFYFTKFSEAIAAGQKGGQK